MNHNMPATSPTLLGRIEALLSANRVGEAYRLLASPEVASDPQALFTLAGWRLSGQLIRRDLAAARDLYRRAAEAGDCEAARIHRAFVASGVGGPRDWPLALRLLAEAATGEADARAELDLIRAMRLTAAGDPADLPEPQPLSDQPYVAVIRGLLSAAECDFLAAAAEPWLAPSLVVDPRTGRQLPNPIRTSDGMAFAFVDENPAIHAINRRIAAATGTDTAAGEPLQVLRYRPGQEYRPHLDALPQGPNQRILTAIAYLNCDYEGGETLFTHSGLRFRGARGDVLIFRNVTAGGRPDPATQHAGLPVRAGVKLIATRWIREAPFLLPPPRPLLDA